VKRFQVRNMIETAAQKDMKEACVYEVYQIPKLYLKMEYCISCAIHSHVVSYFSLSRFILSFSLGLFFLLLFQKKHSSKVRCRGAQGRRVRTPPPRLRQGDKKPNTGKPMRGLKKSARRLKKAAEDESSQAENKA